MAGKIAKSEFVHLDALRSVRPATSTGQVVSAWGQIDAALTRGMKLRQVWEAAKLDGLEVPYPQFRVYVSRLRQRRRGASGSFQPPPTQTNAADRLPDPPADPFRNLREQLEKKKREVFEYDPFSINKNLID